MPAFIDPPGLDVQALLSAPDPVPALREWSAAPEPDLAIALHALLAALRTQPHPVLSQVPLDLTLGEQSTHLDLLLLPSTFAPEQWGTTFLEGLLRKPLRAYRGKRLIELGTGTGWVALALLRFTELAAVLGADLNPEAILISKLNAVLNSYTADGDPLPVLLTERFEAVESDLLAEPRRLGWRADLIVGCIPQVLASAADLYDLSNYAEAQGLVEDQFGLGLNARALQEALRLLEPGGSVILNLAGRPGPAALDRMFRRRGFEPETLWRTRVQQAGDTDIRPLVELEARTGSPFAFQLHRQSQQSVPARVALAAHEAGLPIYHELQVIEGRPRSEALFPLAAALEELELEELWSSVDLSDSGDVLDEQLRFVTRVAEGFLADPRAPYPHEAGDLSFRGRVAGFLRKFHDLPLEPGDVFTAPNRAELLHALLLNLTVPGDLVVLSETLRPSLEPALRKADREAVWLHDDAAEIAELLPHLAPRFVVLSGVLGSLEPILAVCEQIGALLIADESARFEIGSGKPETPGLRLLARHLTSGHLAVMVGLERSLAFPDTELALFVTRDRLLTEGLMAAAELTWSRVSYFHQAYYESLFDELLTFKVNAAEGVRAPDPWPGPSLVPSMLDLLRSAALGRPAPDADVIRLDYGENELPMPAALQAAILHGYLVPPSPAKVVDGPARPAREVDGRAIPAVAEYLRATRLPDLRDDQVLLGMGTLPLLLDALRAVELRRSQPPVVLLPEGSYGMFAPLIRCAGAQLRMLPATGPDFLATVDAVRAVDGPYDLLILTNPANPSGASYEPGQLTELIQLAAAAGGRVVIDEIFGLLADLDGPLPLGQDRWAGLTEAERNALLILGGASKEFAAGGLRLGFAASADRDWLATMESLRLTPIPASISIAATDLFADLPALWSQLEGMRADLRHRRALLAEGLAELGFTVPPGDRGGLFLYPDISALTGNPDQFVLDLEKHARVRLNTPSWSGVTTNARACFAVPEQTIAAALDQLRKLLQ